MRTRTHVLIALAVISFFVFGIPAAFAQNAPAPSSGPLVVERIHNGFVVAPDYKVTALDDRTAQLAGAYGGRTIDDRLLVGGAAYWLVDGPDRSKLTYGGLLVGWSIRNTGRIRFGARGLVGVGTATLVTEIRTRIPDGAQSLRFQPAPAPIRFGQPSPVPGRASSPIPVPVPTTLLPSTFRVRISDDFFVAEPQANVSCGITKHIDVTAAAGYRAVAMTDGLRDRLDGPTGSLAIQFGW
jgi:hypothetical protein